MSTPSTFNKVKAAMITALAYDDKTIEDFEQDLLAKQASLIAGAPKPSTLKEESSPAAVVDADAKKNNPSAIGAVAKVAEEDEKGGKKSKSGFGKMLPWVVLPATVANAAVNIGGAGMQAGAATAANIDSAMDDNDRPLKAMQERTRMLQSALRNLHLKHPELRNGQTQNINPGV